MIDVNSSFSSKLIIDILTIKSSAKSLQSDVSFNIIQKIHNINIPKISQLEIQQISDQSNCEQIKIILRNIFSNFQYDTSLLDDIGNMDIQNLQTINYLSMIVMYSYIFWALHIKDLNTISEVLPLMNALFFVTKSQYSEILMNITFIMISEFCLHDREMNVYDLMPKVWFYVKSYKCYDLIIPIIKHILKDQSDPRFHQFMAELIKFIENYFTDSAIIQVLQQFNGCCAAFNEQSLKYLIDISKIVKKPILPIIIPFISIAIFDIFKSFYPITITKPLNCIETDDFYVNTNFIIGEFEFSSIETFPNGFDPSYSICFPKIFDLSTLFSPNLSNFFLQISSIIQNDDILINHIISSFFKVIDKNVLSNQSEFNLSLFIALLFIFNEVNHNSIKTISIKSEYAKRFFHPDIFNYSMSIFNNRDGDDFTDYYQKINTLRSISLDCILCDDGFAIESILLGNASNYPNFIAELFFRLSKITTVFAHCINKNPKLIKTIINLAISYQHLEFTFENKNKDSIRNARVAIFVTLAHLFSDNSMLLLFFKYPLFLNAFFVFLFEDPIRPFILSILKIYLSKINLPLPNDIPSILLKIFNIINSNLPNNRYLLLLFDLISSLNSSLTYRQNDLIGFREITKVLCQTMVKINHSNSDNQLSQKIFKETISFLILMSPFFEISALEMDALITCILSFKDQNFIDSLYSMFISLLAGQPITPNSTNFAIFQPQIFTLLIQIFSTTSKLIQILKFIYNVISFSPKNLQKCCDINLDLFILKYLENAKETGQRSDQEVQGFLDLYSLLSISHSSSQSVLRYISLLSPIDSFHVSRYHLKFIDVMDQMVIESSKLPRSTFPLNGRVMHVASSSFLSGNVDFTIIQKGFSVAFWIFVEPTLDCNRIFSLKLSDQVKLGIVISNNVLLIYQSENHITNTKPILEELKLHTWTFCSFSFDLSKRLIVVKYLFKQSLNEMITTNSITIDHFKTHIDTTKASLKLGGYFQSVSSSLLAQQPVMKERSNSTDSSSSYLHSDTNSSCRLGSFGLFEFMDVKLFTDIARISLQNGSTLSISPIIYVNDYSEFDETVADGFVDVLACQSGVNMLLPLFLQNDMKTYDDKPFRLSLETILTLLMHILTYSFEAQTNFFQSKGFNIIAQLLTDRWTPFFTIKTHYLLYQTLYYIQYEPLQQQLFDEVMTNFTFIQKLDPDLHYRIVKHWPPLFDSFSSIAQNFSSFEDLVVIMRLFYWYTPIQTQYIKYIELRSDKLNVQAIRKILFSLLLSYASDSFQYSHFQCIIGHCLSCPELRQVSEMVSFLIDVFTNTPDSIQFNVECEPLLALLSYFIRFPDESIRIQVLNFFIITHHLKKVSDEFFQIQVDSIISMLPEISITRTLFDFLIENLESEPLLLNLCCYLAIHFNDASFMHQKRVTFHVSRFWAVLPLYLAIYVDSSVTDFILECGKNELCDVFAQYDIFFERSKSFESIFTSKLLELDKKDLNATDILEVCKRIILFTSSEDETTIDSGSFSLFGRSAASKEDEKEESEVKHDHDLKSSNFFKRDFKYPQLKFHLQFDHNANWQHSKLAVLCLSLFEEHFLQPFLPFDILLCSFLQKTGFDGVIDHLNFLSLNDKDMSECEAVVLPLLLHRTQGGQKRKECSFLSANSNFRSHPNNPLLLTAKYEALVRQMAPKMYVRKVAEFCNEYSAYKKLIFDRCAYMNNINMSRYVESSYKQMCQFLDRQQFQNDLNIRSWRRLWSALSVERAPWHIESGDDMAVFIDSYSAKKKLIFSRDICACFGLAPVKMQKRLPLVINGRLQNAYDRIELSCEECSNKRSSFSKKRGVVFESPCFLVSCEELDEVKKRKKACFDLYKSKIRLLVVDDSLAQPREFTIPLPSLKYVFRRSKNGAHFFTEYGYSFHIEFDDEKKQGEALKNVYSNLMDSNERSILVFQSEEKKLFFKKLKYLESWKSGRMSNYEYILMLNHCAGRSFNDTDRYPIFPWVLNSYSTGADSILSQENVRDFESSCDSCGLPMVAVLTYLNRIEPFKFLTKELMQARKNAAFRECRSMDDVVDYARDNGCELVPEFYSMPEIVDGLNDDYKREKSDGDTTNAKSDGDTTNAKSDGDTTNAKSDGESHHFKLPEWSNTSPMEFVYHHRKILESPAVTSRIHHWFTKVFGKGTENELFDSPHPPAEVACRDPSPLLKRHLEVSIGKFNFASGFISEADSPLNFSVNLLCEDGKLVRAAVSIRHLAFCASSKSDESISSSDGSTHDSQGDAANECEIESGSNNVPCIYSNRKNGFHFSFPRIEDGYDAHKRKANELASSSSNLSAYAGTSSPDMARISSLDSLKAPNAQSAGPLMLPDLTIMETPLNVGKVWNCSKSYAKRVTSTEASHPSFVISSDGRFYVARGQTVCAIDLKLKKIHEVNLSGTTIATSPSNLTSTINDASSSASTSTSSFTIMASTESDKQNLTFVPSKMAKVAKVASKGSERSYSFHGEETISSSHSHTNCNVVIAPKHHQRPRSISAAASFSSARSSSYSSTSTFSMASENSIREKSSQKSILNSIRCAAVDGIWLAVGRDNASISIVCNLRSVATVQLYRSSVSACAVSQTFNVLACGTLDGSLAIYTKNAGKIIKVVDIAKCINNNRKSGTFCEKNLDVNKFKVNSDGSIIPKKIIITPTWGFIVVFCNEIDLGVLKKFICVFTINGEFVRKVDVSIEIDFWACWSSYSGFDYIVFTSESGHVYVNEVFYMNNNHLLFHCRDRIVASYFSKQSSTLVLATSNGKLLFFPIVF